MVGSCPISANLRENTTIYIKCYILATRTQGEKICPVCCVRSRMQEALSILHPGCGTGRSRRPVPKGHAIRPGCRQQLKAPLRLRRLCIGQLPEIYDGSRPAFSRGCFAQAWSVGEILRVYGSIQNAALTDRHIIV